MQQQQDPLVRKRSHTIVHHASMPGDDDESSSLASKDAQLRRWRSISDEQHYHHHHHHHRGLSSALSSPLLLYSQHGSPSPVGSPVSPSSSPITTPSSPIHSHQHHHHQLPSHFHHKPQLHPLPTIKSLSSLKTMSIQPLSERDASAPELTETKPSITISHDNEQQQQQRSIHHKPSITLFPSHSSVSTEDQDQSSKGKKDNKYDVALKITDEQDNSTSTTATPIVNNDNHKPASSTFLRPLDIPSNTGNINIPPHHPHRASRDSSRSTSYKSLNWVASNNSSVSAASNNNNNNGDLSSSLSRLASQAIADVHESINNNNNNSISSFNGQQKDKNGSLNTATPPSNSSQLHKLRNNSNGPIAATTTTPTSALGKSSATPLFSERNQHHNASNNTFNEGENYCMNPAMYICQTIQEFADIAFNILPLGFANAEETLKKDMNVLSTDVDAVYGLQRELDKIVEELIESGKTRNRSMNSALDKVDNVKQRLDSSSAPQRLSQAAAQMKEYETRLQKVRSTLGEWDRQDMASYAASRQRQKEFLLVCVASAAVMILVFTATFIR